MGPSQSSSSPTTRHPPLRHNSARQRRGTTKVATHLSADARPRCNRAHPPRGSSPSCRGSRPSANSARPDLLLAAPHPQRLHVAQARHRVGAIGPVADGQVHRGERPGDVLDAVDLRVGDGLADPSGEVVACVTSPNGSGPPRSMSRSRRTGVPSSATLRRKHHRRLCHVSGMPRDPCARTSRVWGIAGWRPTRARARGQRYRRMDASPCSAVVCVRAVGAVPTTAGASVRPSAASERRI